MGTLLRLLRIVVLVLAITPLLFFVHSAVAGVYIDLGRPVVGAWQRKA